MIVIYAVDIIYAVGKQKTLVRKTITFRMLNMHMEMSTF